MHDTSPGYAADGSPIHELSAVHGPAGEHYTAHCKIKNGSWHCFTHAVKNPDFVHMVEPAAYIRVAGAAEATQQQEAKLARNHRMQVLMLCNRCHDM